MRTKVTTFTTRPTDAEAAAWGCDPATFETVHLVTTQGEEALVPGALFERYCAAFFEGGVIAVERALRADGWLRTPSNVAAVVYRFFFQYL